jgi:alkylation response protein AidB-like acyl-CoA dehydrogenase
MGTTWPALQRQIVELAAEWRADRTARQARRALDPADFARLAGAGFLDVAVPEARGGLWRSVAETTAPICNLVRILAGGDPSVALVAAMHPTVLGFWLARPAPEQAAWTEQFDAIVDSVAAGAQWGTITSEPGSGGDILRTRTRANADDAATRSFPGATYRLSGDKHFGSGSGVTSYMITTAVAEGEQDPALFVIDVRDRPWDGSTGMRLTAEWDGMGMAATQSHAMRLEGCPAIRHARRGPLDELTAASGPLTANVFTAVVVGILDEAIATAQQLLAPRADGLRAYERVEWTRAGLEHWLAVQAHEGALRAIAADDPAKGRAALRAKEAVAELAETSLGRLTRVIGGGTYSRRSPFAAWYEDVRALGFLRPPWGLAYDTLFGSSFA